MFVNTMVPIFHAQNLLHILKKKKKKKKEKEKKEKARIKFMNFSQKYMGSVFLGHRVCVYIYTHTHTHTHT